VNVCVCVCCDESLSVVLNISDSLPSAGDQTHALLLKIWSTGFLWLLTVFYDLWTDKKR